MKFKAASPSSFWMFFFFAFAMAFVHTAASQSKIDSLVSGCTNAHRYGLITPNSWNDCFQSLACAYSGQLDTFAQLSEDEALTQGFVSGYYRTRVSWKTTLGPDLVSWFDRNEVYSDSYKNSIILLLFHRHLNGENTDPIVVTEQLRESHVRLNKEAAARFKSEAKYQRLVQRNIRKSRQEGIRAKKAIAKAEKKQARKVRRNLKRSEPEGWDFD